MPVRKEVLQVGKSYRITLVNNQTTPGYAVLRVEWIPKEGQPAPPGTTLGAAPGMASSTPAEGTGNVPDCAWLWLRWDVPDSGSSIRIRVEHAGATLIDEPSERDNQWWIRVVP